MPPSATRSSQRTRKARDPSPGPVQAELSSPSRPSKRRKKAQPEVSSEPLEEENSTLTLVDQQAGPHEDEDDVVSRVVERLTTGATIVQASRDHANAAHESTQEIAAYAKVAAPDWTYYIRDLNINIGRNPEPTPSHPNPPDPKSDDFVHIDLGPAKTISRQTATIFFDADSGNWLLRVKGRNALRVNGAPQNREDEAHVLSSGAVLEVGGVEMMFVLPGEVQVHIHDSFMERLKSAPPLKQQRSSPPVEGRHALPGAPSSLQAGSKGQSSARSGGSGSFQQPIAPAPPDYKRPGTPPSAKSRGAGGPPSSAQHKSPAFGSSGAMVMHNNDADLSLSENKHIKPLFSYAQMITQAIISTPEQKLSLSNIYGFIMKKYSYYKHQQPGGWQNSIRHNLSLNKAFCKAPRSTDEPGKGMKWELVPEQRDEMINSAWKIGRGGHRGSSAPSSPNQPNQLNYITKGPREMASRDPGSARKRKASPTGRPNSSLKSSQMTPERDQFPLSGPASFQDGSPVPRSRKGASATSSFQTSATDNAPGSPPTLSSTYLQDDNTSFVTPAPLRVHPRLAPPSTAPRPSQHMLTSSPADFWKYIDVGSTPAKPAPESPSKLAVPGSSSPPAAKILDGDTERLSPVNKVTKAVDGSPTRAMTRSDRATTQETVPAVEEEEEEGGFDLTKPFQNIGSYHANLNKGVVDGHAGRV